MHENTVPAHEISAVPCNVEIEDRLDRSALDASDLDSSSDRAQGIAGLEFPCHRPPLPCAPEAVIRRGDDLLVAKTESERGHGRIPVQADDRLVRQNAR